MRKSTFLFFIISALIITIPAHSQTKTKSKTKRPTEKITGSPDQSMTTQELEQLFMQSFKKLRGAYVDEINEEVIIKSAIRGMLEPLDPYTVFLEGAKKERIEIMTRGKYGGVGIHIATHRDSLIIMAPIENSPAYREGIMAGDIIVQVDSTETFGLSTDKVSKLIKGQMGSEVTLHILRPSTKERLTFTLIRDNIQVMDIPYAGLDQRHVGYIRINRFSKNVAEDFKDSLKVLIDREPAGVVIDLRGNSGGLLNQAIEVLDALIPPDQLLLSTSGRTRTSKREKTATRNALLPTDIPLAVLIDKNSASASEIVAGVLQDLDRAVIVGTRSFGKGLVQSIYTLNEKSKLKITTAKYYTPSGRLVQKMDYLKSGALTENAMTSDTTFTTVNGRKVEGGGGITPDHEISSNKMPPFVSELWRKGLFLSFASVYVPQNNIDWPVTVDDRMIGKFEDYVVDFEFSYKVPGERELEKLNDILAEQPEFRDRDKRSMWQRLAFWRRDDLDQLSAGLEKYFESKKSEPFSPENSEWIRNGLLRESSRIAAGSDWGAIGASLEYDPVYQAAVDILLNNNQYAEILSLAENPEEVGDN